MHSERAGGRWVKQAIHMDFSSREAGSEVGNESNGKKGCIAWCLVYDWFRRYVWRSW
jgi:hypothetical protein